MAHLAETHPDTFDSDWTATEIIDNLYGGMSNALATEMIFTCDSAVALAAVGAALGLVSML